jgi:hypothetical protein
MALSFDLFSPLAANIGAAEERIAARIGAPDMSTEDLLLLQRNVAIWSLFTSEVSTVLAQFRSALQNVLQNVGR